MNNILGLVFCTSILDFKSYRLAKSRFGNFQDPAPKIDKIPFYASITSTTCLIPYIFMAMALGNFISNFSPVHKFYTVMVLSTIVNMIRNPLTGLHYFLILQKYYVHMYYKNTFDQIVLDLFLILIFVFVFL